MKSIELILMGIKLLIGGAPSKFFHLKEFSEALQKLDVKTMLVKDSDFSTGFPSKKPQEWFRTNKKFKKLVIYMLNFEKSSGQKNAYIKRFLEKDFEDIKSVKKRDFVLIIKKV